MAKCHLFFVAIMCGLLEKTGNTFTVDGVRYTKRRVEFTPETMHEYRYGEKRYVRVTANIFKRRIMLSNGVQYKNSDAVWVEIESVKWLLDNEKALELAISEKLLFAGVQYNYDYFFLVTLIYMSL